MNSLPFPNTQSLAHSIGQIDNWLSSLVVDPITLREKQAMKGKKHFVELLLGYQDLFEVYKRLNRTEEMVRLLERVKSTIAVIDDDAYHDLAEISKMQFIEDALSYFFACYLVGWFGIDNSLYLSEIKRILPRIYEHIPARGACQRMAFIRRLKSLDLPATDTMNLLVHESLIRKKKDLASMLKADVYIIVHEVFHFTESGKHPATLLNQDDLTYLANLFGELLVLLNTPDGLDLLAEVVVAMLFLDMARTEQWWKAVDFILQQQNANGSFGSYEASREQLRLAGNPYDVDVGMYLHTTIVCLKALALAMPLLDKKALVS